MTLNAMEKNELPAEVAAKLLPDETTYHFGYIDRKGGGCGQPTSTSKQWITVTNQRILFEAAVKDQAGFNNQVVKFVHQSGSIPIAKVSFVGTSSTQTQEGCSQVDVSTLRINSSGGEISLAIPTAAESSRIQSVIDEIISKN